MVAKGVESKTRVKAKAVMAKPVSNRDAEEWHRTGSGLDRGEKLPLAYMIM